MNFINEVKISVKLTSFLAYPLVANLKQVFFLSIRIYEYKLKISVCAAYWQFSLVSDNQSRSD